MIYTNFNFYIDRRKIYPYQQNRICAYIFEIKWKYKKNFYKTF